MTLAPLLARSLADSRPIPALAPVPTFLLAPAGKDDPGPLLARSQADFRPIPALAPVPTFLLAPAGKDDLGSPAGQVASCLQAYSSTGSCPYLSPCSCRRG